MSEERLDRSVLPLDNMSDRHYGLTQAVAQSYLEAARVCLDRHHLSPQDFILRNDRLDQITVVEWELSDQRIQAAWGNSKDTTEIGAYACGIAAIEVLLGFYAVGRAEQLTGADYYISPINEPAEDFENCFRLEVSGTDMEGYEIQKRLINKVNQTIRGQSSLPAYAVVVGFKGKLILIQFADDPQ